MEHLNTFWMLWYSLVVWGLFEGAVYLTGLHTGLAIAAFASVSVYLYKDMDKTKD
jgi:hypothetical protein